MAVSSLVTNEQPQVTPDVPERLLYLFQQCAGQGSLPFLHQAQTFESVMGNQEVLLVAGTAAGKTLAVAVPLFHELETGRIGKVLLMYPTIALMEDQRRVMDDLARITGLKLARIQGGMSRTKLIEALSKPVILATPDEVYWFFRKNVKYSGLLVYGLALVDEFVLDEAHLFNGLMLRNFEHLWRRVQVLARGLGKSPRLHILTATPTEALKGLSGAPEIRGQSKCDDIRVEFRPCNRFDRGEHIVQAVSEALAAGQRKVLVVCNSARMTHQLFESHKVDDVSTIPVEHRLRFGKVTLGALIKWLEKSDVETGLIDALSNNLLGEEDIVLGEISDGTVLRLPLQNVIAHAAEVLDRQCWQVKRALWERNQCTGETWESLLNNRRLPCLIIAALRKRLESASNVDGQQAIVDEWLANAIEQLSDTSQDPILCQASKYVDLTKELSSAGLDAPMAALLTERLKFEMKVEPTQIPARSLSDRPVYLRRLSSVAGKENADKLREAVRAGLESGELEVECRHIGLWKRTNVPVIVYSGSMSKVAREGLIGVFADLESAVLISTSAVEVGVDFHADALITEECEGNSFLQRFGRVGRHGKGSQVVTLVSGDAYSALASLNQTSISRQEFSAKIIEVFPPRNYAAGSIWLDASHYLVNQQLGRIGERLNSDIPDLAKAKPIADELRSAQVRLSYGLRGSMPQIALRDGVTKDPFYLLRYVDDDDLRSADSPFEVARAHKWFTGLIFEPAKFDVIVDLDRTLKTSEHLFILHRGQFKSFHQRGIGLLHLQGLCNNHVERAKNRQFYFLLLHGDVYLSRLERGTPTPELVRDSEQNPVFIPAQTYLVLCGWKSVEETHKLLEDAKVAHWEELYYDEDRLRQDWNPAMVILEKTTGACFAAYKELVDYAGSQI